MAFSREHPSSRYQALLAQYQQLHREGERARGIPPEEKYKGISLPRHAGTIKELIDRYHARTVLDYGSGKGKQYEEYGVKTSDGRKFPSIPAFWGVDSVTCYDPAVPQFAHLPIGEFDGVVSTDVLEHVPEQDVDWIVAEMLDYARRFVFLNIASFAAKAHLPNGENAHCTIQSADWWRRKLTRLHADRRHVHLLALVVELQPGDAKAKLHRIDLPPTSEPGHHAITLDLDRTTADQLEQALAPSAEPKLAAVGPSPRPSFSKPAPDTSRPTDLQQAAELTRRGHQQFRHGAFDSAARLLQSAAKLAPRDIEAQCNHGTSLLQAGRRAEAEQVFRDCLAADAQPTRAKFNLASCLLEQGDLEGAFAMLGDLIAAHPSNHPHVRDARWVRALILLQMENFSQGWPEYEQRWQSTRAANKPVLELPEYRGQSLAGKRIMIYGEQGIGDEIMFASCLPTLLEQAAQVMLICSPRLESLFRRSFAGLHVWGLPQNGKLKSSAGVGRFDYQLAAGSLPRYTRAVRQDFAQARPFLAPDPRLVAEYRDQLAQLPGKLKVGIAWRGGSDPQDRRLRSMPLATWGPILRSRDVDFIDLQYDSTAEDRREIEERYSVRLHHFPSADPLGPLDPQAALMAALDLVISVDNAGVHLAGGLGQETWVLLPAAWGWRWHRQRDRSLFYPRLQLFRQRREGDWATLAAGLGEQLRQRVAPSSPATPRHAAAPVKISGPNYLRLPPAAAASQNSELKPKR